MNKKSLLIIDCQNDFITGSLACQNSEKAVLNIVDYINKNPELKVFYSCDWHKITNKSFQNNGGIWPVHCVEDTEGASLSKEFTLGIKDKNKSPQNAEIVFKKGINDDVEEYSAYNALNIKNEKLYDKLDNEIIICGIASEYCVKETILELQKNGFNVTILANGLGYVDESNHSSTLKEFEKSGTHIIY
ncbi:nicotinamidase [Clostridium carboxidivorans P7]|uniref:nicotinamidase n=1 Tax=Clostridium carboxidivorans P7 TaxID=536227 RepID=C6Q0M0_9CLOT|nr:isochorismatase family protein [Clostridium carboxidivorans]AKN32449.1 nicotinamidase [Clostridium carboxidivorans P7]EET84957.1 isochorismatase hydrolase [Clostridium carboxidivorans P7]EFG87681.1 isochorismatase family protein [Clostridium carboxidivorans P7]EFG87697.1 isochorismatase family protein [Clostridium carboxidivorans P7]